MGIGDIIRPDEDVDIGYAFSGAIRCRKLTVLEGGSVTGTVVAERVDVKGSLNGVADCEYFQALPPAFVRGTVFAPNSLTRDKDGQSADVLVLHSSKRQAIFHLEPPKSAINFEEVISTAIDEALAERISPAATDEPAPSEPAEQPLDKEMELFERLASKGLASLLPDTAEPDDQNDGNAVETAPGSARATSSGRTPLPSLV